MKTNKNCPYCGIAFSLEGVNAHHTEPRFSGKPPFLEFDECDPNEKCYTITSHKCPECHKQVMWLNEITTIPDGLTFKRECVATTLLFPKNPVKKISPEVPEHLASDFQEAHDTLYISPKASAALSRRCLQNVIREQEGITERTLYAEITALLALNKLPQYIAEDLDSIRNVGNFAAHPTKDTNTGQIVEVEPGEAEWTLEVLEELLSFYFVQQSKSQARRDALNQKLREAGKGPMLSP